MRHVPGNVIKIEIGDFHLNITQWIYIGLSVLINYCLFYCILNWHFFIISIFIYVFFLCMCALMKNVDKSFYEHFSHHVIPVLITVLFSLIWFMSMFVEVWPICWFYSPFMQPIFTCSKSVVETGNTWNLWKSGNKYIRAISLT